MLAGHDRGARVAYRLTLDHPDRVIRLARIDTIPTLDIWELMDMQVALDAFHWPLLAQPAPVPEVLIGGDPDFYLHHLLRQQGLVWNRKRTYRIYTALGLQVRRRRHKKLTRPRVPMPVPSGLNQRWSVDFMSDQLSSGRRFRILNVVDDYSRECVGQIVDFSISGERLARFLDQIGQHRTLPKTVVCDNGSELTSKAMFFWSQRAGTRLHFIQPGKPTQNAFVESFNDSFRDRRLNQHWFGDLADARRIIDAWRQHYNEERPHSSLGYLPPAQYARQAA